jgi:hypothetical protein
MKKKASGKAAARKPTGKAVGRKSNIDTTVEVIDPRAKKTVDACITAERDGSKAGGSHCRRRHQRSRDGISR